MSYIKPPSAPAWAPVSQCLLSRPATVPPEPSVARSASSEANNAQPLGVRPLFYLFTGAAACAPAPALTGGGAWRGHWPGLPAQDGH